VAAPPFGVSEVFRVITDQDVSELAAMWCDRHKEGADGPDSLRRFVQSIAERAITRCGLPARSSGGIPGALSEEDFQAFSDYWNDPRRDDNLGAFILRVAMRAVETGGGIAPARALRSALTVIHGLEEQQATEDRSSSDSIERIRFAADRIQALDLHESRMSAEFEAWWRTEGEFLRAGGGSYEKTFAWHAWRAARVIGMSELRLGVRERLKSDPQE
jgi:hypothetical protein